jgi:5-methylcytosine-specific restriction enzyme A
MARSLDEWWGATDDTPAPPRVRARVFLAHGGVCHITGRKIAPGEKWELDHVVALINGGENKESNLAPALAWAHKAKTARDVAQKAKDARVRAKHIGAAPVSRNPLPGGKGGRFKRKINGEVVPR